MLLKLFHINKISESFIVLVTRVREDRTYQGDHHFAKVSNEGLCC